MMITVKLSILLMCLACITTICVFGDLASEKEVENAKLNQANHGAESMNVGEHSNEHASITPANGKRNLKHNSTFIGFTAWKQSPQFYEEGEIIEFDGITLNEGGHFKEAFNWFECPTNGVYFVAVTFCRYESYVMSLSVVKEGTSILDVYDRYTYNPWSIVSESAITRCDTNERIWVEGYDSSSEAVFGEPGMPHTTFTIMKMDESDFNYKTNFHSTFAGFSAWNGAHQIYNNSDIITYQYFNFNEGDHFEPEVNRFICPVTGIYFVTVNQRKYSRELLQLSVVKNNLPILHTEDIWSDNYYTTVSNTRLVSCAEGEFIAVKATGSGTVYGSTSPRTTYSAMLMYSQDETTKHSSFVGFTAYKTTNQSYEAGQTIRFEDVLLNEGNGYDRVLDRFVCPYNGIYYVSVTFKKFFTTPLQIGVEHENAILLRSIDTETLNPWSTVSNSGLVRCFQGEEIKVSGVANGSVYGDESKIYTTFTVFMMYQY